MYIFFGYPNHEIQIMKMGLPVISDLTLSLMWTKNMAFKTLLSR